MATSSPVVELVLARLRDSGDFPAMARTVGDVSTLTSSEATSTSVLAEVVLKDYGLAQKLLRLVNTAAYAQHDQVTTISRAVLLMGFDRVRTVATGLMVFEHLQAQAKTPAVVDALNMSFYSAILGRTIADRTRFADPEEAFISALFHNLGRTLVALYLPQEAAAIQAEPEPTRDAAVLRALGMSYTSVGMGVARALNLPPRLTKSLNRVSGAQSHQSMTEEQKLGCLSTLSNGIADALASQASVQNKRLAIDRLVRSYGAHFSALENKVDALIASAEQELREHSKTFRLDLPGSAFAAGLGQWQGGLATAASQVATLSSASGLVEAAASDLADETPETLMTRGLHEITGLLVTEFTLDDVLRVILETIYRALGVERTRAFFLLKDPAAPVARFRFGMGQSPSDMRTWLEVPLDGAQHMFSLAMAQARDLVIKDLKAPDVAALLPAWYRQTASGRRFAIVLPLVINQKAVGMFYIDGDDAGARLLTPPMLNYLKVLRGQAVLAIHQNSLRVAARRK